MRISFFYLCLVLVANVSIAHNLDLRWVKARGGECRQVCSDASMSAVATDKFNGKKFMYICAANAANVGFRAGFNLVDPGNSEWANSCNVDMGNKYRDRKQKDYVCLCSKGGRVPPIEGEGFFSDDPSQ